MIELIRESFQHMSWADACVWKSIAELPQALNDNGIHERLYHIHATQHAFYQLWNKTPLDIPEPSTFTRLDPLLQWTKEYHRQWPGYLDRLDPAELDQPLTIPWEKHIEKRFNPNIRIIA